MNSISNIEIINFDELNQEDRTMNLEEEISLNYMNNFLKEKYESDYSESQCDLSGYESPCNMSICSDINSNFSNPKLAFNDSSNNSIYGDQTAYSENIKTPNLNDSFFHLEKITSNSFSFLRKTTKFKLNIDSDNSMSNISIGSNGNKFFPCTYEGCEKVYKSKENLTLHYKNIHLREKPYSCKFCNSQFSHRNGKTYHERKFHTKYLPHKCYHENCTLSFASKSALSYHLKSQHGNNNKKHNRIHKSKFNEKIMEIVGYNSENN